MIPLNDWRACACARSLPAHADTAPDPAGGDGCGMAWWPLPDSDEIEERHISEVQPGGHLRQDVPAGLGLPNHQNSSEESVMVGRNTGGRRARFRARKTLRFGPVRVHFTERGLSSWGIAVGRWTWNARTGRHTIDTPGPGAIHLDGRKRGAR